MERRILMIDDDEEFTNLARTWITNAGYEFYNAGDGTEGIRRFFNYRPDLVLLDINMPKMDGWEVCRRIRDMSDTPILMTTVNGKKSDRLRGFGLGIDDYLTKPFDFPELVARIKAVLQRVKSTREDEGPSSFYNGEIEIEWGSRHVSVRGTRVKLTPTEFRILSALIKNRGWIVTHEQLLEKAWGPNYVGDRSFVKLYVRYLRKKIEEDPHNPKYIMTERGVGYYFATNGE